MKKIFYLKLVKKTDQVKRLSFFDKIVFVFNLIVAISLLLSFVGPHVSAKALPFLSPINLIAPILVFANTLFLIYWILKKKKQLFLSLVILILGYFVMGPFYKFNSSDEPLNKEDLSIMSFNARDFDHNELLNIPDVDGQIVDFVKNKNPDIICFQEFYYSKIVSKDFDQYSYNYVDFEYGVYAKKVIQAIYSKYPIVNKGILDFPKSSNRAIYVDILYKNDTIRIYNLHLESLRIIPTVEAITTESSDRLYKRLTKSFTKQQEQAQIFLNHVKEESSYKKIVCGDFNNNQYSNVYHSIKGNMIDTFFDKGQGFGKTYDLMGYPLRIDFILVDDDFEVKTHKNYDVKLSDHYPIMSSLHLKAQ